MNEFTTVADIPGSLSTAAESLDVLPIEARAEAAANLGEAIQEEIEALPRTDDPTRLIALQAEVLLLSLDTAWKSNPEVAPLAREVISALSDIFVPDDPDPLESLATHRTWLDLTPEAHRVLDEVVLSLMPGTVAARDIRRRRTGRGR